MIIFWMILMKFKEYTIQLAISVKTDEMGNENFSKGFFLLLWLWLDALLLQISKLLGWFLSKTSFRLLTVTMMDSV
jgi:hypothetical protein